MMTKRATSALLPCALLALSAAVALSAFALSAFAEPATRPAPLDPLELRAEIRLAGDEPTLEALEGEPGPERLHAIRASSALLDPALAIPSLIRISATREAFEAEAALHAVAELIHHLDEDFIARGEHDPTPFKAGADALAALHDDEALPLSWRSLAALAAIELRDRLGE